MKSHLLRLEDLLLFEGLDDLLLLELEDPPFLPLDPLELSSLSGNTANVEMLHYYNLKCSTFHVPEKHSDILINRLC